MLDVADLALLGSHLALDFVNTVEDRAGAAPDDVLRTADDLRRWGERQGITVTVGDASAGSAAELAAALRFRESLHAVLDAVVVGHPIPIPALGVVEDTIREAHAGRRLARRPDALLWQWPDAELANVRHEVALAAEDLLTDEALLGRTKRCPGESCGWFYLDRSKNNSRRWCSMRGCGTRAKTQRRAHRSPSH